MAKTFYMNGYLWRIRFVDPENPKLVDRTYTLRVATTDPETWTVYLSRDLSGPFLYRVLIHELGHCALFSYDLLYDIHRMAHPSYWVEAEEWVCNFIADYGMMIFNIAYRTLGHNAWKYVPYALERYFIRR